MILNSILHTGTPNTVNPLLGVFRKYVVRVDNKVFVSPKLKQRGANPTNAISVVDLALDGMESNHESRIGGTFPSAAYEWWCVIQFIHIAWGCPEV